MSLRTTGGGNLRAFLQRLAGQHNAYVDTGIMENATYPDGTPVAAVAFWNEFGVPDRNQPPRPFIRNMISQYSPQWAKVFAGAMRHTNHDVAKSLAFVGERMADNMSQSIEDFTTPTLAESTVEQKGFDKPLIDTGQMQRSITYRVKV